MHNQATHEIIERSCEQSGHYGYSTHLEFRFVELFRLKPLLSVLESYKTEVSQQLPRAKDGIKDNTELTQGPRFL